ncbi:MAG: hypothetical protein L0Y58_16350 [Verrucomicrobia subdivision 3 bacterium]|nr:hypothetical protein [Limisphaerales bacterium]
MKTLARFLCVAAILGLAFTAAAAGKGKGHTKLRIQHDRANGKVVISWDGGKGSDLAQSRNVNGQYHRLRHTSSPVVMDTSEDQSHFQLVGGAGSIYSINVLLMRRALNRAASEVRCVFWKREWPLPVSLDSHW